MPKFPRQRWADDRTAYYALLTDDQKKVMGELDHFQQNMVDRIEAKQDKITAEVNEYERHATGFFALCLSLLVTGLLTSQLDTQHATNAAKVFFFTVIVIALLAAAILFIEYIFTFRLFNKWQKLNERIVRKIIHGSWRSPEHLTGWIEKKQKDMMQKSTHIIQIIEGILIVLAFTFIGLWLFEILFNPDWPYWPVTTWKAIYNFFT